MEYTALSDIGLKRDKNEDSWNIVLNTEGNPVGFIVADGMGGYLAGEEASRIAVEEISSIVMECIGYNNVDEMVLCINKQFNAINERIMKYSVSNLGGMNTGTTLSVGILKDKDLHISHIGDSRVYQIRNSSITRITQDHTYVAELLKGGLISDDEAQSHPEKNKITRALGFKDGYLPDFYHVSICPDDVYVFCTDGLYEHLTDDEILDIIISGTTEQAAKRLIELANGRGGNDNITVVIARV